MKKLIQFILVVTPLVTQAQINCEVFRADSARYQACLKSQQTSGHYQFSRKYQEVLDEALAIDSTYAPAYKAKSVAYLKSGDFIGWKRLMDKAVALAPKDYLGYRGWCRYQFFRDYAGAIADIERLDSLVDYDIGTSANGVYHLQVARALCYKALGQPEKAIAITEQQFQNPEHILGNYDYLHLGILYLESGQPEKALQEFEKQQAYNPMADAAYYAAQAYSELNQSEKAYAQLLQAKKLYQQDLHMFDPYTEVMDRIYLRQIEDKLTAPQ